MIIHPCVQGSRAWLGLRLGKPTASSFDRIVTPGGKPSSQQDGYLREILAELIMGRPIESAEMPWMTRGKELEAEAVSFYEFQRDTETEVVGFITNDEETIGASPDRMVGEDGLLEIKVPKPETHVGYLLFNDVDAKYKPQLQGQLYVTGRKWVDICSYHPEMPEAIVRVERDDAFIKLLDSELQNFVIKLAEKRFELSQRGMLYQPPAEPKEFLTDQDAELILAAQRQQRGEHGNPAVQ